MELEDGQSTGKSGWVQVVGPWLMGLVLLGMALLLAILGEAKAEDKAGVELQEGLAAMERAGGKDATIAVEGGGSYIAPATVKGASMAAWRGEARASYDTPRFGFDLGWTTDRYDFTRVGRWLPIRGDKPFESLTLLDAGVTAKGPLWQRMDYFVGLRGNVGFEREVNGGFGASALAGAAMPLGADWALTLGGGVSWNRIEIQAFPVVGVRYESASIRGFSANLAFPKSEVAWRVSEYWGCRLTGSVEDALYKLSDDHALAADGYVEMFSSRVGAWLDLWPTSGLSVNLGALYALPGRMTFYRESGSRIKGYDVGGAPGGAVRLRYEF
jgi:hypothetical protein